MMRVLSQWFPGTVKPVREGHYLVRTNDGAAFDGGIVRLWSGEKWRWIDGLELGVALSKIEWRGLAFDPHSVEEIYSIHRGPGLFFPLTMVPR